MCAVATGLRYDDSMPATAKHHPASVASRPEPIGNPQQPFTVGFFLLPNFSMMAFAAAIEPLRAANRLSKEQLYEWRLLSADGAAVAASNRIDIAVHEAIADGQSFDLLLVCASLLEPSMEDKCSHQWLRGLARNGVAVGGISLGAYVLAYAGLLDGRRCALHWESLTAFTDQFPRIHTTSKIFVIDGNRFTCSGGTAALDMMLQVITDRHGRALANDVSEQFIHPRIRAAQDSQRMAIQSRFGVANEKLIAAIAIMETAEEEPRPVQAIAAAVGLSPRQLERLFEKYVNASPSRFYLKLRLDRARAMLQQTSKSVLQVAVACGFESASHFSRCYRAVHGQRPSDERAAAPRSGPRAQRAGGRMPARRKRPPAAA